MTRTIKVEDLKGGDTLVMGATSYEVFDAAPCGRSVEVDYFDVDGEVRRVTFRLGSTVEVA